MAIPMSYERLIAKIDVSDVTSDGYMAIILDDDYLEWCQYNEINETIHEHFREDLVIVDFHTYLATLLCRYSQAPSSIVLALDELWNVWMVEPL